MEGKLAYLILFAIALGILYETGILYRIWCQCVTGREPILPLIATDRQTLSSWCKDNPAAAAIVAVVVTALALDIPIVEAGYQSLSQDYWDIQHEHALVGVATAVIGFLAAYLAQPCWWAIFVAGLAVAHLAMGGPWN